MDTRNRLTYVPPTIAFDDALAQDIALAETQLGRNYAPQIADPYPSPFADYHRQLTEEGGIIIYYRDIDRSRILLAVRIFTAVIATGMTLYLIAVYVPLTWAWLRMVLWFAMPVIYILIVARKFSVFHSVEIQPDRMIIDGDDVFLTREIGGYWPELQYKNENPDRASIAGVCGTRWIDYMTANRTDDNDFTPEVLIADLHEAMEQLWGRTEVNFDTAP